MCYIADAAIVSSKRPHKRPGGRGTTAALTPTVSLCILRFDLLVRRWTVQRLAVTSRQVPVAAAPMSTPDAMICIPQSPFGPTWFYLEYRLKANGPKDARSKVRGYQSPFAAMTSRCWWFAEAMRCNISNGNPPDYAYWWLL